MNEGLNLMLTQSQSPERWPSTSAIDAVDPAHALFLAQTQAEAKSHIGLFANLFGPRARLCAHSVPMGCTTPRCT